MLSVAAEAEWVSVKGTERSEQFVSVSVAGKGTSAGTTGGAAFGAGSPGAGTKSGFGTVEWVTTTL